MAIGQFSSQVVATQLEQVNNELGRFLVEKESSFAKLFTVQPKKHRISAWTAGSGAVLAWRIPILQWKGGDYQAVSLDGGDLGTGSMMSTQYMTIGYFSNDIAFNIPLLAINATKSQQQAMTNTLQFSTGAMIQELALYNEIGLFQDGTGILATATAATAVVANQVTYTLETAAFLADRLRGANQLLDIYSTGGTLRVTGARVVSINFSLTAPSVTLSIPNAQNGYTVGQTDVLAFPGMGSVNPGSWRYGIYTFNTTNTTGSLLGLSYASSYELACPTVNAGGGFFTPAVLFAGKTAVSRRRDAAAMKGLIGVCDMAQRTSWYLQGVTIANQFLRPGDSAKAVDLAGQGTDFDDTFVAGDVKHHITRYANKSRVDWFNPKNFGWVQLDDLGFFQTPDGQRIFVGHNPTTGNPQAGFQFFGMNTRNLYTVDPACSVVYTGCAIPSGQ